MAAKHSDERERALRHVLAWGLYLHGTPLAIWVPPPPELAFMNCTGTHCTRSTSSLLASCDASCSTSCGPPDLPPGQGLFLIFSLHGAVHHLPASSVSSQSSSYALRFIVVPWTRETRAWRTGDIEFLRPVL
ncbi:hypothetical protein BCR43DRAFT_493381 [Syncephalastrum racemosum]|uniref:Uncharacterized protein n=1 Tax=Syncephalastrum racemosum TaxID=13706 RepID=A0A1X2HAI9_SYNRA|nr:hypothetical protein BCR43DRAFT_493381 [Syncephalastrum racemosum]